jgi:hypothetical protein
MHSQSINVIFVIIFSQRYLVCTTHPMISAFVTTKRLLLVAMIPDISFRLSRDLSRMDRMTRASQIPRYETDGGAWKN